VGAATALAIVREREQKGPFREPAALPDVPGIGPATLRRVLPHLDLTRAYPVSQPLTADPGPVLALNGASLEELDALPGIGPALARRILEERDRQGGFATLDDLLAVRGIGKSTLERLQPLVTVP
jgi:competence protein ComEA